MTVRKVISDITITALVFGAVFSTAGVFHIIESRWLRSIPAVQAQSKHKKSVQPIPGVRPKIRVGLFSSDDPVTVTNDTTAVVKTTTGTTLVTIAPDQPVTLSYDRATQKYSVVTTGFSTSTDAPVRLVPQQSHHLATITSYSNSPAWNTALNDNQFYGSIALHYASADDAIWVVNKLGIENYVKGVAEASNSNPAEYLQTLYTAARTYAYYNYLHPTKHTDEPYLLDATANDQVYRGYGFSKRSPNVVAAVDATRGQVVTYHDAVVVTPYFSQSDGRTRAWSEVWSGDYPYLQSVSDPCCTNTELLGHGVGLSAEGALYFANEGWDWLTILQYYYQGISVMKEW